MIRVSISKELKKSQKEDFLMANYECVGTNRFEANKKEHYCKRCVHALILENGVVCPFGLNDKW